MDLTPFVDEVSEYLDKYFPKGECQERGQAIVLLIEIGRHLSEKGLLKTE